MLYIMCMILSPPPTIYHDYYLSWRPLISSKDQEKNLVAGEKNPSLNSSVFEIVQLSTYLRHPFLDGIRYA